MKTSRSLGKLLGVVLFSGVAAFAAACSSTASAPVSAAGDGGNSDGGKSDAASEAPPSIEEYCQKTYGVYINMLKLCCNDADRALEEYAVTAEAFEQLVTTCVDALSSAADKGRITLDAANARACIDGYAPYFDVADTCWDGIRKASGGPSCFEAVVGSQSEGDACARDLECKKQLWCDKATGKCVPPAQNGGSCASPSTGLGNPNQPRCVEGSYCPEDTKKCASLKKLGATCKDATECASKHCYLGKCDDEGPVGAGKACDPAGRDCEPGLYCKATPGSALGTCTKKLAAGSACTAEVECSGLCKADKSGVTRCVAWCGTP